MTRIVVCATLVVLLVAGAARGQAQFAVTDLGSLGGTFCEAWGINDSGEVVGVAADSGGNQHAFLYSNGTMQQLPFLYPGPSCAYGINDSGQVVGEANTPNPHTKGTVAFVYSGGTIQSLGLGGQYSCGYGINNNGQIAGYGNDQAFLYSGGTIQNLGRLSGDSASQAFGINDSGQVVGSATDISGNTQAFLYSDGTMQNLGTLVGDKYSFACGINDSGQVVGYSEIDASGLTEHAFLYANGTMQNLGVGVQNSSACGINGSGQVVGYYDSGIFGEVAFLWQSGTGMQDLNSLIPSNSGWTLVEATGINASGQICGWGVNPSGQSDAFLLTPTPEPSSLALLAASGIGLVVYGFRRRAARRQRR